MRKILDKRQYNPPDLERIKKADSAPAEAALINQSENAGRETHPPIYRKRKLIIPLAGNHPQVVVAHRTQVCNLIVPAVDIHEVRTKRNIQRLKLIVIAQ